MAEPDIPLPEAPVTDQPQRGTTLPADGVRVVPAFAELGTTGLRRWAGTVDEEFLRELRGRRGVEVFREMRDNDEIVGAILYAIRFLARKATPNVTPFDDSREAQEQAEFVEQCLDDMSYTWDDTLTEALSMLPFGWAFHEVVYKYRGGDTADPTRRSKHSDNRIGWRKIALRAQETLDRWEFQDDGGLMGLHQLGPPDYLPRYVPIQKALLFRTETAKGNPEGRSILRNAYRSWYFKKNIQQIEGIGVERDLAGYPVIQLKEGAPDIWNANDAHAAATLAQMNKLVRGIRRDEREGAVVPYWADLKLINGGGSRQIDTTAIIERYDRRIAMTVLADFILVGHEQVGSKALFGGKVGVFATALGGILGSICAVFNRYAIPPLLRLNGWHTDKAPKLEIGKLDAVDLVELGDFITKLSGAGFPLFPNPQLEDHLMTLAGLPLPDRNAEGRTEAQEEAELRSQAMQEQLAGSGEEDEGKDDGEGEQKLPGDPGDDDEEE